RGQEHEELAMGRLEQVRQRVSDAYAARRAAVELAHDEGFGDGYAAASAAVAHDDGSRSVPTEVALPNGLRLAAAWSWRMLVIVAAAAVVLWLVGRLRLVLVPLAIALLPAALLTPAVRWLRRQAHLPRSLATAVVLVGGLVV